MSNAQTAAMRVATTSRTSIMARRSGHHIAATAALGVRGYRGGDGSVEIFETEDRKEPTYVLLRVTPHDASIYLVVRGADFIPQDEGGAADESEEEKFFESDEYFYGYICHPSITLRNTVAVILNGEADPHGIFEYIATRPASSSHGFGEDQLPDGLLGEFLLLVGRTLTSSGIK